MIMAGIKGNSTYKLVDMKVPLLGNVNPVYERVTKEWREQNKGENPPIKRNEQGKAIYEVEYGENVESFGRTQMSVKTVKVPDGPWRGKVAFGVPARFVNLQLMVGLLRDDDGKPTGYFASMSADDVLIGPDADAVPADDELMEM